MKQNVTITTTDIMTKIEEALSPWLELHSSVSQMQMVPASPKTSGMGWQPTEKKGKILDVGNTRSSIYWRRKLMLFF